MKAVYVPVYRVAVSYTVSFGRRWSVLEHLLLIELANSKRSLIELAEAANLPERLVVEALINLMRANWIEVRSTGGVHFQATKIGHRRAAQDSLPPQVQTTVRWISLCVDRLTGNWLRAEDLDLVYDRDLPEGAEILERKVYTYDQTDGSLRDLFKLALDETLEPVEPQFRNASRPYARVFIAFDRIEKGLPASAPMGLQNAIVEVAGPLSVETQEPAIEVAQSGHEFVTFDQISSDDLIVGGDSHQRILAQAFESAKSRIILHSCFLDADATENIAALRQCS
jgi:hypothetical protein